MSSPNEPGEAQPPRPWLSGGDARPTESIEVPPWQRAAGRAPQPPPEPPARTPKHAEPQPAPAPTPAAGPDPAPAAPAPPPPVQQPNARVSRYITGTAAPAALQQMAKQEERKTAAPRAEVARPAEYASELPDLSGPPPRPPQPRRTEPAAAAPAPTSVPPAGRVQVVAKPEPGAVRATMQIRRIDPWSALKVSALLSVALFFVWMIAVAFLYLVLGGMGVWSKLNSNVGDLLTNGSGAGGELVSAGSIFGGALLIGLVNIVLLTAMATIGAFVYNLSTDIVGGVEVTLADRD